MFNQLRKQLQRFISPVKNSMTIANQFLRGGNKAMRPDWTQVVMDDRDVYTGYGYAAITRRANAVATMALENIKTETTKKSTDGKEVIHPHLQTLSISPTFQDYDFWFQASTYLDLEGVFYVLAIRNFNESGKYGGVKEFKILNPYRVKRVVKDVEGVLTVGGYIESRGGYIREIPKEQIIDIRELNPFDDNEPYAMTDAAKESQFTLKTAGDYTRHTLKHNINAPGIMSTDVILPDQDFENFTARVKSHTKGEPIFGNGKGAIDWNSMNIDMSKSALKEVNDQNRDTLFAVAGVSKTIMGIEESGTTRETAKVQKDLMIEAQVLPRLQKIVGAFNQDYKNNYPEEFKKDQVMMVVENPTATDHDADIKGVEVKQKKSDLYTGLVDKGYNPKLVAQYVNGDIEISALGEPKPKPEPKPIGKDENSIIDAIANALDEKKKTLDDKNSATIKQQESVLQNAVVNIDQHLVADFIVKIEKNAINELLEEKDIITKSDKNDYVDELTAVLVGFYGIVMMLHGGKSMRNRMGELALPGTFTLDSVVKKYIKNISVKVAESHIQTVIDDILLATREAALKGLGQKEIVREIRKKYDVTISEVRAKAIARTETNRAFTRAQYEADRQFIKQNKLTKRAFKQWKTRSDNPCAFCASLERQGPIPFGNAFKDLGDEIEVDGKTLQVGFEALQAGNAHTNCNCIYELVLLDA